MAAVLEFESVSKTYGQVTALSGVDMAVERGIIFGIVGPDGAGKSTMLRLAMGLVRPDSGVIRMFGGDPRENRVRAGYVPQRFSLYQNLTVMENLSLYSDVYGVTASSGAQRELLERMGLWEFRGRLAGLLSGGMKQKLMLAACVAHGPEALFLDEPTTGVDPLSRRDFWTALYEMNARGVTVIVSTPYMDEAELCSDLVLLNLGEVIMRGAPNELLEGYGHVLDVYFDDPQETAGFQNRETDIGGVISEIPGVSSVNAFGSHYHVEAEDCEAAVSAIRRAVEPHRTGSLRIEKIPPSLEDLFISGDVPRRANKP
ncbi:MAG: ABC transporter ATP-binding protein [Synergistaceae bacterium]|jgi:ABC-2 type transport system ATP-binding protein|nr:ABC transporter ATP-binding protein [Synergistaceae bacterium]